MSALFKRASSLYGLNCMLIGLVFSVSIGDANSAAIVFTDRSSFESSITIQLTEGFQSLPATTTVFTGPITLPSGITISSPSNDLFSVGAGQSTNPTTAIGSNTPLGDFLGVDLGGDFFAFGLDIFQNNFGGAQFATDITFDVTFLVGATIIDILTAQVAPNGGSFFGVISSASFDNVRIFATPTGSFEVIDDVTLGDINVIPLPAALPLYGTGLAVMGFLGWRRKRQALRD